MSNITNHSTYRLVENASKTVKQYSLPSSFFSYDFDVKKKRGIVQQYNSNFKVSALSASAICFACASFTHLTRLTFGRISLLYMNTIQLHFSDFYTSKSNSTLTNPLHQQVAHIMQIQVSIFESNSNSNMDLTVMLLENSPTANKRSMLT